MSNPKNNRHKYAGVESLPKMSLVFMAIGAIMGYLGSEIFITSWSHHLHWISGAVVAILAFLTFMIIYERFGDIF
jgi:hypothetical protein